MFFIFLAYFTLYNGLQLSYFKSKKILLLKCCTQYASKFGNLSNDHRVGKGQFSFQSQRAIPKNVQTTAQLHSFHMLASQSSKFSTQSFNSMWTENFHIHKLDLEKTEEPEIKLPTSIGLEKKQGNSIKTYSFASLTMLKLLTLWITTNCGKFLKRWEYQTIWPASWETCMEVKKQQLELDMEKHTGSKFRKEYVKAIYCHPAYSTYMQSTSWEMPGWMKQKLESRLSEVSMTSDM